MLAKALLVVGLFAVVNFAGPAPFFWYEDYYESSSEEDEPIKHIYIYLNVTDFNQGNFRPGTDSIPIDIPINVPGGQPGSSISNIPPLDIPIKVTFTVGNGNGNGNGAQPTTTIAPAGGGK